MTNNGILVQDPKILPEEDRVRAAPPRLIFWETTAACNLRCIHCRRLDVLDQVSEGDLSTAAARAMIENLSADYKPVLVLSGGEPLMRPDLLDLAVFAGERGLRVALATNGTLVTAARAGAIRRAGIARVSISLDGARPATHDRFRGAGGFARALEGFDHLRREGVALQINMTVTRYNAEELPALYDLCLSRGARALHLFMLVPVGCGVSLAESDMLSPGDCERWLNWLYDREQDGRLELKATCAPQYFRIVRQRERNAVSPHPAHSSQSKDHPPRDSMTQVTRGCLAGQGVAFVSHKGEVFPCGYLPLSAGHVGRTSFREIWESAPVFQRLRRPELLEGKCGACCYKGVCGGCRARAWFAEGRDTAQEPCCDHVPAGWRPGNKT